MCRIIVRGDKNVLALAKEEGYDLSDDELEAINGGVRKAGKSKRGTKHSSWRFVKR